MRQDSRIQKGVSRVAHWRMMEIHKVLSEGGYPNCSTLGRTIEKDPKTIQRDINHMRDQLGLPIEYDQQRRGYYYTKPVDEFPMLLLSKNDLVALFLARHALEPLRGTKLESILSDSFQKIASACPGEVSVQWQDLDDFFSVKALGVLPADFTLFKDLLTAIDKRSEVRFCYRKLKASEGEPRRVQPYHLGQIEHGWYLIAWDPSREGMRTFALQRMSDLELIETRFRRDPKFKASDFLSSGFGVWSYESVGVETVYDVKIRFRDYAARIVSERRWHPSQKISPQNEGGTVVDFEVRLAGLEEITRWILSWGSKAEVLAPEELKNRLRLEIQVMLGSLAHK
jgi:predicted DNA-binding transcriptional regulator YafY